MPFDLRSLESLLVVYGINCLGAFVIGIVGWRAAGLIERLIRRAFGANSHIDPTVSTFLASLAYYGVLVMSFILILQVVGIQATSLVAVLGAASLAIGLALQGTLANMAAGVMLLLFRPFRLGESIEVAGKTGTVRNLNLFMTELVSGDNVQVLIPNGQIWGAPITNLSAYPTRTVNVKFTLPADGDLNKLTAEIQAYIEQDKRILTAPATSITVAAMTDTGPQILVQVWTGNTVAGAVRADLTAHILQLTRKTESSASASR